MSLAVFLPLQFFGRVSEEKVQVFFEPRTIKGTASDPEQATILSSSKEPETKSGEELVGHDLETVQLSRFRPALCSSLISWFL